MDFRTRIPLEVSEKKISHDSVVLLLGSCFAENMGQLMRDYKFPVLINPFGIQFHSMGIENALMRMYSCEHYTENEIFQNGDLFFSWDHSAHFSSPSKSKILHHINNAIDSGNAVLQKANVTIITLGTAWVYKLVDAEYIVSNCHKVPARRFKKLLLPSYEILGSLRRIVALLQDVNPGMEIIFTVSPVRHIKDGFVENNVSKGRLLNAVYEVVQETLAVSYFPSYEIVMDELRDYRFYKDDFLHPNDQALKYIWERFADVYFTTETQGLNDEIASVRRSLEHRPINPHSIAHKKFRFDTLKKLEQLAQEFPRGTFDVEIEFLKKQLHETH
ncbi:MAG: GSCFA domain-containing protein [Weeksellaceae bacterium]|nr:GSCFA domain-containing protein [Weeksellaceae bacterium]